MRASPRATSSSCRRSPRSSPRATRRAASSASSRRRRAPSGSSSSRRRCSDRCCPSCRPELGGLRLEARSIPAARVGGDLYDVVVDDQACVWLVIADVTGHGVGSALMMASVRAVLRLEIRERDSPAAALRAANATLYADLVRAELLVTALCARWEPRDGTVTYASAAHNPALLRHADGRLETLDADGTPLGLLDGVDYEERTASLGAGATLLLYTDGVVEARDAAAELLGDERLATLVAATARPAALVDSILAAVDAHLGGAPRADDVTLLAVTPT
ncbi:MAG: PP2C family protein-serine/threonine phosphatase [Gaiellaceae bacterium]